MNQYNKTMLATNMPERMRNRPVSAKGYAVPWFVTEKDVDGDWEFRAVRPNRYIEAHNRQVCWVCGQMLGRYRTFAIGPMCAVNRVTSEPPSHRECAEWSMQVCPFMANPRMRRNAVDLPEGAGDGTPGIMIDRNPGVAMLWHTERSAYAPIRVNNGFLFKLKSDPLDMAWYRQGRRATRAEVMDSVNSGLSHLERLAKLEGDKAEFELTRQVARAKELFFDRIAA